MIYNCYRHNIFAPEVCPTPVRCLTCKALSRIGWAIIHLATWIAR